MKNINYFLILLSMIVMNNELLAQKGSILSVGVSQLKFEDNTDFPLSELEHNAYYIAYEAIPSENLAMKFQYHRIFPNENINYWDGRLSFSYLFRAGNDKNPGKGSRISLPITFSGYYYHLDDELNNKYGNFGFGVQGGIRFYLTYKIAIEGSYGANFNAVNKIDDEKINDEIGTLQSKQISIGLSYFLN